MDPNQLLADLLASARRRLEGDETEDGLENDAILDICYELAEGITALDSWIRGGGFLPATWRTASWDATALDELAKVLRRSEWPSGGDWGPIVQELVERTGRDTVNGIDDQGEPHGIGACWDGELRKAKDAMVDLGLLATLYHTGGGCWVIEVPIDLTGRDHKRVIWVTREGEPGDGDWLIGFYDHGIENDEGICITPERSSAGGLAEIVRGILDRIWAVDV